MKGKSRKNRTKKPKKVGFKKHQRSKITKNMILFDPGSSYQSPYPRFYRTKFISEYVGHVANGAAVGDIQFNIKLNCPELPFADSTSGITGFVTIAAAGVAPNTGQDLTSLVQPTGYTNLANQNLYRYWKVHASKLEVDIQPGSSSDTIRATCTPSLTAIAPTDVPHALSQPLTKWADFSTGKMQGQLGKNRILTNYQSVKRILGYTRIMEEADQIASSGDVGSNNFGDVAILWTVNLQSADNDVLHSALGVRVRVIHYVTLYNIAETLLGP